MSFFNSVLKVFGFGNDDADYNDNAIDATVTPLKQVQAESDDTFETTAEAQEYIVIPPEESVQVTEVPVDRIFEKVVEIFNSSLPDFIAQNIDKEKQQHYIYEALDESLKQHLKDLAGNAEREAAVRWQNERKRLINEIDRHKENSKKQTVTQEDLRSRQLSAERQKRALSERLHDMEGQIATLEAEREQYDLENKSLINKLRAASIQDGGDGEQYRLQIAELEENLSKTREELQQTRLKLEEAAQGQTADSETAERLRASENRIQELTSLNESLTAADRQNRADIEQLTARLQLAESMTRESQSIASTAKGQINERDAEIDSLKQQISALKSDARQLDDRATVDRSTITELEDKNRELSEQLASMATELETANENLKALEIIEKQLEKFEEIKNRKDAKIKELNNSRESLIERIRLLENERRGLKRTVETNIIAQSESELSMRDEIARLRKELSEMRRATTTVTEVVVPYEVPAAVEQPPTRSSSEPARISAIDESLDNTDWLVATPPEGTSMRNLAKNDDNSDFGYQAPPPRKPIPDNDAQMSLWDDEY